MKYGEFLTAVTSYYGDYQNDFVKKAVFKWICENLEESKLETYYTTLISKHSNRYKTPPDIATLHSLFAVNSQIQAENAWQQLVNKSAITDVLITDPYSYAVVAGYGSWDEFCKSRDDYTELTHKEFIKRYTMFRESGYQYTPRVLRGALIGYENVKTQIIGDEARGRELLEYQAEAVQIGDVLDRVYKNDE